MVPSRGVSGIRHQETGLGAFFLSHLLPPEGGGEKFGIRPACFSWPRTTNHSRPVGEERQGQCAVVYGLPSRHAWVRHRGKFGRGTHRLQSLFEAHFCYTTFPEKPLTNTRGLT